MMFHILGLTLRLNNLMRHTLCNEGWNTTESIASKAQRSSVLHHYQVEAA